MSWPLYPNEGLCQIETSAQQTEMVEALPNF